MTDKAKTQRPLIDLATDRIAESDQAPSIQPADTGLTKLSDNLIVRTNDGDQCE